MKKGLLLYIILLSYSNCFSTINCGIYCDTTSTFLVLFKDSTFYYCSRNEFNYQYSFGKWENKNEQIVLNSIIKESFQSIKLINLKSNIYCDSILVNIQFSSNSFLGYVDTDYYCIPYINDCIRLLPQRENEILDLNIEQLESALWNKKERGSYEFFIDYIINNISFDIIRSSKKDIFDHGKNGLLVKTICSEINTNMGDSIVVQININSFLWGHRIFDNEIVKIESNYLIFKDLFYYAEDELYIEEKSMHNKAGVMDITKNLYWDKELTKNEMAYYMNIYQFLYKNWVIYRNNM
jgi:hypothetical protein